jgi:hypothetical protein
MVSGWRVVSSSLGLTPLEGFELVTFVSLGMVPTD